MRLMSACAARNLLGGGLLCVLFACGGEPESETVGTISREVFVDTYVQLRMTALHSPDGRVGPAARDEILGDKGVTEAELMEFVDAHGLRVQFMVDVWAEIDDSLRYLRTQDRPPPP